MVQAVARFVEQRADFVVREERRLAADGPGEIAREVGDRRLHAALRAPPAARPVSPPALWRAPPAARLPPPPPPSFVSAGEEMIENGPPGPPAPGAKIKKA